MIKIELIGPNGENLLRGTWAERVKRLGLPVAGLMGGMVLSFFLASSLVAHRGELAVNTAETSGDQFRAGIDYALPAVQSAGEGVQNGVTTPVASPVVVSAPASQTRTQVAGKSLPKQVEVSDPMLDGRILAAQEWLGAHKKEWFSIQLMSVQRSSLGELKDYLTRTSLTSVADKIMAFPVAQDRLLFYYGHYASYEEAMQAIATLPASVQTTKPYVLSGKNILGKVARLNKEFGKQVGLVAALKP